MQEDLKIFFGKIMEDNKQKILRICSVYANDPEDRKDLFHDVALNIWKGLPSFREEAKNRYMDIQDMPECVYAAFT